jgi:SOS-response transcriptional repressor LexA
MVLTQKQKRILDFIRRHLESHELSPTYQEIADELDVSKITVFEHIQALIKKGFLENKGKHKCRALRLATPHLDLGDGFVRIVQGGAALRLVNKSGRPINLPTDIVESRRYRLVLEVINDD